MNNLRKKLGVYDENDFAPKFSSRSVHTGVITIYISWDNRQLPSILDLKFFAISELENKVNAYHSEYLASGLILREDESAFSRLGTCIVRTTGGWSQVHPGGLGKVTITIV
jgi:hypothetical protein